MAAIEKLMIGICVACLLCLASFAWGKHVGTKDGKAALDSAIATLDAEHSKALASAVQAARTQEQQAAADQAAITSKLIEDLRHEKQNADATVAGLRAGAVQLRDRFTCADASPRGGVPSTSTSAAGSDATAARGLQPEDAEFLVRESSRADQVAQQLAACQAVIQSDRSAANVQQH